MTSPVETRENLTSQELGEKAVDVARIEHF